MAKRCEICHHVQINPTPGDFLAQNINGIYEGQNLYADHYGFCPHASATSKEDWRKYISSLREDTGGDIKQAKELAIDYTFSWQTPERVLELVREFD